LSSSIAWAALAFADAVNFVFNFFFPTWNLLFFFLFLSLPSTFSHQIENPVQNADSINGTFTQLTKKLKIVMHHRMLIQQVQSLLKKIQFYLHFVLLGLKLLFLFLVFFFFS